MASPESRRRAQRRLARQIRERTYQRSNIGRRAREAAQKLRRENPPGPVGPDVIEDLKAAVIRKKRAFFSEEMYWNDGRSNRYVDRSDDEDEMEEFLSGMPKEEAQELAHFAALALLGRASEEYLVWIFLFYH